eukprot:gene7336-5170_t
MRREKKAEADVALSILCYCSCSVSMIILNKLLMQTYGLPYPISLLLFQNTGAFLLVSLGKRMGVLHYPDISFKVVLSWLPLTALFVTMLYSSMKSLQHMSVSAQTITKNLAIIGTAFGDHYFFEKKITRSMTVAFVLMIAGSYLGTQGDKWVTALGLWWTAVNIVSTVFYTLYMKKLMAEVSKTIGNYGPVFYNNLLSLPIFFIFGFSELKSCFVGILESSFAGKMCLLIMMIVSSFMTFGVFWCMKETSPTTFSVLGALNKVPITFLGMVIFQQFPDKVGYAGIAIALSGGFLYSVSNSRQARKKEAAMSKQVLNTNIVIKSVRLHLDNDRNARKLNIHIYIYICTHPWSASLVVFFFLGEYTRSASMKRDRSEADHSAKSLPETRQIVQGAFATMREYATAAGSIPAADYEYHSAFPGFTRHVESQSRALQGIMEQCLALLPQRRRPSLFPATEESQPTGERLNDAQRTVVMEAIDSMLENVDAIMDEVRGNKLRGNDQLAMSFGSELVPTNAAAGSSVNTGSGVVQVSRVVRPQLTFKTPVDNTAAPFVPVYSDEQGAMHTGKIGVHPFEKEIKAFKPSASQLQPRADQPYLPLEQCPLTFVDTVDALKAVVKDLLAVEEIAVDLEHHDFYSFLGFTCLMQISTRTADYIIDCIKLRGDMKLLAPVFLSSGILKVLHGAKEDIRWLQKDFSLYLVNFFDTGIALQTLHMPYSLAFAVDHFCQVKLEKKYQTADWRIRPLPAEMVHYARQDTHFLLYVYDRLKAMLLNAESRASVGNLLLHVYSASKSLSLEQYEKPVLDPDHSYARSLDRSLGGLTAAQRRVAQFMYNWRDEVAREVDDSPIAVLHQSALLTIASKLPLSARELLHCANPVSAVLRKNVAKLVAAIQSIVAEEEGAMNRPAALDAAQGEQDSAAAAGGISLKPMGLHRPMTGSCPSLVLPPAFHPTLAQPPESSSVELHVAPIPPTPWLLGMRRVAERLQQRPKVDFPLPGADIVAQRARLQQQAQAAALPQPVTNSAATKADDDKSSSESLSRSGTPPPAESKDQAPTPMQHDNEAVALRQAYGTGAKNRRKEKKTKKERWEGETTAYLGRQNGCAILLLIPMFGKFLISSEMADYREMSGLAAYIYQLLPLIHAWWFDFYFYVAPVDCGIHRFLLCKAEAYESLQKSSLLFICYCWALLSLLVAVISLFFWRVAWVASPRKIKKKEHSFVVCEHRKYLQTIIINCYEMYNRELLAGARFEPLAPTALPSTKRDDETPQDLIKCTRYAIPRCMARIAQTENRQLNPSKDFTYESTTVFKAHEEKGEGYSCTSPLRRPKGDSSSDDEADDDNPPMTFTFTEYSPMCYAHVRSFFTVNSNTFGRVLRTSNWHSTPSPGKSSAHIFFCDKWVIKTMTKTESEFLRQILHRYYFHVRDNPWTFLPHFVGHYQVKLGMASYNLIVMQNVFLTKSSIHRIYDLKGSTVGRFVSTRESQRTARMLKDLDLNSPIRIGPERKGILMRQLIKDTDFLKKCMIMDYSLLVGIHEMDQGLFMEDGNSEEAPPSQREQFARFAAPGFARGDARFGRGAQGGAIANPSDNYRLTEDDGGILSTVNPGFPNEVYYTGIIDILQRYSPRKRLEHFVFGIKYDPDKISCVHPNDYADRFLSFISSITV